MQRLLKIGNEDIWYLKNTYGLKWLVLFTILVLNIIHVNFSSSLNGILSRPTLFPSTCNIFKIHLKQFVGHRFEMESKLSFSNTIWALILCLHLEYDLLGIHIKVCYTRLKLNDIDSFILLILTCHFVLAYHWQTMEHSQCSNCCQQRACFRENEGRPTLLKICTLTRNRSDANPELYLTKYCHHVSTCCNCFQTTLRRFYQISREALGQALK